MERENRMREKLILSMVTMIYREFLRDVVIKYVSETDNSWDDRLVLMLDSFLDYRPVIALEGR